MHDMVHYSIILVVNASTVCCQKSSHSLFYVFHVFHVLKRSFTLFLYTVYALFRS